MPGPPAQKILVVPIAANQLLASAAGQAGYVYFELDLPEAADLGPYLAAITAHTDTRGPSAQARWTVAFQWSYDEKTWYPATPIDLFAVAGAAAVQAIQLPYTVTGNFGLKMKFMLAIKPNSGTALETVTVSATLVFEFKS